MRFVTNAFVVGSLILLAGCGDPPAPAPDQPAAEAQLPAIPTNELRDAYFGAVHVHTSYSFDAFTNGTISQPADAYAWARGEAIEANKAGLMIKVVTPLDFYAVSDHAEMMGVFREMQNPESPLSKHPLAAQVTSSDANVAMQAFAGVLRDLSSGNVDPAFTDPEVSRSVWAKIVDAANEAYEPGRFTTFPAFEWTSNPSKRNLHRVVVFRDAAVLPELVLSSFESEDPEHLWRWMETQRAAGATLLAIPHNANASDGRMFSLNGYDGKPLTEAHIAARRANEPLYELSQIKGTSETHPLLSPTDEFADFEIWNYTLSADAERPKEMHGSYVRAALLDGLGFAQAGRGNPFQYGFIGDTDTHNAAASNEEFNHTGKFAIETNEGFRLNGMAGQPAGQIQQVREFSSGGLAGVWATQNTREGIYDAMLRKETFGTSGPHIKVRLFGGWDFSQVTQSSDWVRAGYAGGVPMGGELANAPDGKAPTFIVWALKDPNSGNLDRVQLIKGWVDADREQHERIVDVVWSDRRVIDGKTGKLPPVGDTVDVGTATYVNSIGDAELFAVWTDPEFEPKQHAFYYVRVLEIPTPRWSTRDAAALGIEVPGGLPPTIQERAWSSPIWYAPRIAVDVPAAP